MGKVKEKIQEVKNRGKEYVKEHETALKVFAGYCLGIGAMCVADKIYYDVYLTRRGKGYINKEKNGDVTLGFGNKNIFGNIVWTDQRRFNDMTVLKRYGEDIIEAATHTYDEIKAMPEWSDTLK